MRTDLALACMLVGVAACSRPKARAEATKAQTARNALAPTDTTPDLFLGQRFSDTTVQNFVDERGISSPRGLALDKSVSPARLYVVDSANNRVLVWPNASSFANGAPAIKVLGQPDMFHSACTTSASGLCNPTRVAVDSVGNVYVSDTSNNRVLEYNTPFATSGDVTADRVYGQAGSMVASACNPVGVPSGGSLCRPLGVAVDPADNLYIADSNNNRVVKYVSPLTDAFSADVVLGQPALSTAGANSIGATGLASPQGIAIDRSVTPNRLFVADTANSRILGWADAAGFANNAPATLVLGQSDLMSGGCNRGGRSATSLCSPRGLTVDGAGTLYVADTGNNRVLAFRNPFTTDKVADAVWGQIGFANLTTPCDPAQTSLCGPAGVAVNSAGDLFVADSLNVRVLKFSQGINGDPVADQVFGQASYATRNTPYPPSASSFSYSGPAALTFGPSDTLYVVDPGAQRVLIFNASPADTVADALIGPSSYSVLYPSNLAFGTSIAVDGAGNVFVTDSCVRVWLAPTMTGAPARTLMCAGSTTNATTTRGSLSVALDSANNLYIAEGGNNRVVRLNSPLVTDGTADAVLGQGDFTTAVTNALKLGGLNQPSDVAIDSSTVPARIYVSDSANNRVLAWSTTAITNGMDATKWFGQPSANTNSCLVARSASTLCDPGPMGTDSSGNLYVTDQQNYRVLEYNTPFTTDAVADRVFGEPDFASIACSISQPNSLTFCPVNSSQGGGGLALDSQSLLVSDTQNHRVLAYSSPLTTDGAADAVLGQNSLTRNQVNFTDQNGLLGPYAMAIDTSVTPNRLYVADTGNHRILGWSDVSELTTGKPPSLVIGQPDMFAHGCGDMCGVTGLAVDGAGRLIVAGYPQTRIYDSPFTTDLVPDALLPYSNYVVAARNGDVWLITMLTAVGYRSPRTTDLVPDVALGLGSQLYLGDQTDYEAYAVGVALDESVSPSRLFVNSYAIDYTSDTESINLEMWVDPLATDSTLDWGSTSFPNGGIAADRQGNLFFGGVQYDRPTTTDALPDRTFFNGWGLAAFDSVGSLYATENALGRVSVFLANSRAVASALTLTPTTPKTADTLTGAYTYSDADANPQGATTIRWFKNDVLQPALNNTLTVPASATTRGDVWYFVVHPHDGIEFGPSATSPQVTIGNTAPTVSGLGITPPTPLTADDITATWTFSDGDGDAETQSDLKWFLNGSEVVALRNLKTVPAALTTRGDTWSYTIAPGDGFTLGASQSFAFSIGNTPPSATSAQISPASPQTASSLSASWLFSDPDSDTEAGSQVRWYRNGVLQAAYNDLRTVPGPLTLGDVWTFVVTPRDGTSNGTPVTSTNITVGSTAPAATALAIAPAAPTRSSTLTANYTYADPDGQPETASQVRWSRNGVLVPGLNNLRTVPSPLTKGDVWQFTVTPCDNTPLCGGLQTSAGVTVQNTAPVATGAAVTPAAPRTADVLTATWTYGDADADPEAGSAVRWFRNGQEQVPLRNLRTVPAALTTKGELWHFTVQPGDGTNLGGLATSADVLIDDSAPVASTLTLTPTLAYVSSPLKAAWAFTDADGDLEVGSEVRWYVNGVEDSALLNATDVPPARLVKGAAWAFSIRPKDGVLFGAVATSPTVVIANSPPTAGSLAINPPSPLAGAALTATYTYQDADHDPESMSVIHWFRNDVAVDAGTPTLPAGVTARGERWRFSVRPSDGVTPGLEATSADVTIANTPPSVSGLALSPSQPGTDDPLIAGYVFSDVDGDSELGSDVRWYRNSLEMPAYAGLRTLPATATTRGESWYVVIKPKDGIAFGAAVTSTPTTIYNTPPVASNATLTPASPRVTDNVVASYAYFDADADAQQGTEVRWFRDGAEVSSLFNQVVMPAGTGRAGETWFFTVKPRDGVDFGLVRTSTSIIIGSSAPVATALAILPVGARTEDVLTATYTYADPDGNPESGSEFHWFRDGLEVAALLNSRTVPPTQTARGESWTFTVRPKDGTNFGAVQTSPPLLIANTPPAASRVGLMPTHATRADTLLVDYVFTDADGDNEGSSDVRWFRSGVEQPTLAGRPTVPPGIAAKNEVWFYRLKPHDGFDFGGEQVSAAVVIENSAPVADAGVDQLLTATGTQTPVTLDGTGSLDLDRDLLVYSWSEGTTALAQGARPTVSLPIGTHTITLTVSDGVTAPDGGVSASSDTVIIDIADVRPSATVQADATVPPGIVTLVGQGHDDLGRALTARWAQTSGPAVTLDQPNELTTTWFGVERGPRTFTFEVSAGSVRSQPKTITITTENVAPWAVAPRRKVVELGSEGALRSDHSDDPNGDVLMSAWQVLDGPLELRNATASTAQLVPTDDGEAHVSLVIGDGLLTSPPRSVQVIAVDRAKAHAPMAQAGLDGVGDIGTPYTLDGRGSYDVDGDELHYTWRRVSGPQVVLSNPSAAQPLFKATTAGTVVFGLTVGDGTQQSAESLVSWELIDPGQNHRPIARAEPHLTAHVGSTVSLDASRSTDADGDALTWAWTQREGVAVRLDPTLARPTFVALRPGWLKFSVAVSDGKASSSPVEVVVQVTSPGNSPPAANAGSSRRVGLGAVTLDASASSDPEQEPLTYRWEQLLGPPVAFDETAQKPTFSALGRGLYRFSLVAWDHEAPSVPTEVDLFVSAHGAVDTRPVANAGHDLEVQVGSLVTLDGTGSHDDDTGDTLTYEWTMVGFPTGAELSLSDPASPTPSFTPNVAGTYQVRLRVSDGELWSEPVSVNVLVGKWASNSGCGCTSTEGAAPLMLLVLFFGLRKRRTHAAAIACLTLVTWHADAKPKTPKVTRSTKTSRPSAPSEDPPAARSDRPVAAGPILPGPPAANGYLDEARRLYGDFQFDAVLPQLDFALAVKGISEEQRVEVHRLAAMTHLAAERTGPAVLAFLSLLELRPKYDLGNVSPKVRASFTAAQRAFRLKQAVVLEHQPPMAVAGKLTTTIDVRTSGGTERVVAMTVHFRPQGGSGGYSQVELSAGEGDRWSGTVPNVFPGPAGLRTIEYFLRARDTGGGVVAQLGEENHPLEMKVETIAASTPFYKSPLFWGGVAVVVGAAIATPFLLRKDAHAPAGSLGVEVLK